MRVMVVGASRDRTKFGNRAVRAYLRRRHDVLPINPNASEIEGLRCFTAVDEPAGPIDRALMYLHPEDSFAVVTSLAERGDVAELWLNPGAESPALVQHARSLGFEPILACAIVDIGERP